jgi:hypothetical protein
MYPIGGLEAELLARLGRITSCSLYTRQVYIQHAQFLRKISSKPFRGSKTTSPFFLPFLLLYSVYSRRSSKGGVFSGVLDWQTDAKNWCIASFVFWTNAENWWIASLVFWTDAENRWIASHRSNVRIRPCKRCVVSSCASGLANAA